MTRPEDRARRLAGMEAEVAALRERLIRAEPAAAAARLLRREVRRPVRPSAVQPQTTQVSTGAEDLDDEERRITALEAAVRELNDRMDDPWPYLEAAEAEQLARIRHRYPDLAEDRRKLD